MTSFYESFEQMTISQLRKLTEEYKSMEEELKLLRVKYPTKAQEIQNKKGDSIQDILKEVGIKCL